METLRQTIIEKPLSSASEILEQQLDGLSEVKQLDPLTELLTIGHEADERMAEVIYAAWCHLCEKDLWSIQYDNLEQYRRVIGYYDIIRPIIRRFKRSDREKFSNMDLIESNWNAPVTEVIPSHIAPQSWSNHMLSLLATLSKEK
ncbi:uncharacterized protein BO88DRAFT_448370 [Aspergillus vadensis CBS 113365]|uniref:Uncharacterized protein n=1 Tax=Aspergillus vadensis (strain CBS 113365 / IMI 142717 / IBT 24658) TaxID=1448311 RepID=A0A319BSW2_ASPVC|nr:hypothetical protein BO88DRAFT_448370 [Aspergillus vadensis CBS 113365]PYH74559.1 hypothetical protein BO88DRAFT_448370 [Aspergillus vadensis CBS 113365]